MTSPEPATIEVTDLDADDLTWAEHAIAGAAQPAGIVLLHADPERNTRTVMVRFPDGWQRDAVGHQPAGEEMVILDGELRVSGHAGAPGAMIVVEPKATRAATSTADGTRALVWFSGAGGGWADGEAADAGPITLVDLASGDAVVRDARGGLNGEVLVREDVAGAVFDTDVDVLWPGSRQFAHVPAGLAAPAISGRAVVHTWA